MSDLEFLKKYELDEKSINEFRSKIKGFSFSCGWEVGYCDYNDYENGYSYNKTLSNVMKGANFDEVIFDYSTGRVRPILHITIYENYLNTFMLLLRAGANPNITGDNYETPLMIATKANNIDMIRALILMGADVNLENVYGRKAIDYNIVNMESYRLLKDAMERKKYNFIEENKIKEDRKYNSYMDIINEAEEELNKLIKSIR